MTEVRPIRRRKGRGAHERILAAATLLYSRQGINATGMDQLSEEAHVSKRTLYAHFANKDELVRAYLQHLEDKQPLPTAVLKQSELPARERLLLIFDGGFGDPTLNRGCPFLNAAVEIPDPDHPTHVMARDHKLNFARELTKVAGEAGAHNPKVLGDQLALLWDGAAVRGMVLNSTQTGQQARVIAAILIDAAISASPNAIARRSPRQATVRTQPRSPTTTA
jgi:AcrR family transcriptional regulator